MNHNWLFWGNGKKSTFFQASYILIDDLREMKEMMYFIYKIQIYCDTKLRNNLLIY